MFIDDDNCLLFFSSFWWNLHHSNCMFSFHILLFCRLFDCVDFIAFHLLIKWLLPPFCLAYTIATSNLYLSFMTWQVEKSNLVVLTFLMLYKVVLASSQARVSQFDSISTLMDHIFRYFSNLSGILLRISHLECYSSWTDT